ncbi:hypothetical protein JGH11_06005 [Dysgonomonas sp. Marseille-P4677]|uniref:hypothetical protein n=1 Tax=Dysgonomonas sp. Marseille-P4677 TaxID=2364790 RepID=UPI001912F81C|nr:hypothetical protein [Dysgonomonas sp. Marseille-P4677]MBK5720419.1 hypothetical protein [Dysgonomonas sp. Marseille-P4677]
MLKTIRLILGIYPRKIEASIKSILWYRQIKRVIKKQVKLLNIPFFLVKHLVFGSRIDGYIAHITSFGENVNLTKQGVATNYNYKYGCGIFILIKN